MDVCAHLGRDGKQTSIILHQAPELKLVYDKWYDVVTEVKGNEIVVQIDGRVHYGKNDLILKDRYDTFNLDSSGAGFLMDKIEILKAGDYQNDWEAKREKLGNDSPKALGR
ncbi:MAG: hypothetical protein IH899_02170 [Planctomycetes bacterium]|nr:hypothetical protein [Planctomycetota bacterium]